MRIRCDIVVCGLDLKGAHLNSGAQQYARADKRAKLPRWINQYITETASNLSTDMALVLSKLFMRHISQTHAEDQMGISLWTLADIEKAQEKQRELETQHEKEQRPGARRGERGAPMDVDLEDDEYGDMGFSDRMLGEVDLDV